MAAIMPILLGLVEDIENNERTLERRRIRDASNPFHLTEGQFISLFRISKDVVRYLCISLKEQLKRQRSHGLTVEVQAREFEVIHIIFLQVLYSNINFH
jgi:hypothetical protein